MRLPRPAVFAFTGWAAGALATVVLGLLWPTFFPGIVEVSHYYGAGPGLPVIIVIALILASPGALVGGVLGSRIPREGGRREQMLLAGILGAILALPCGCWGFWVFTGY